VYTAEIAIIFCYVFYYKVLFSEMEVRLITVCRREELRWWKQTGKKHVGRHFIRHTINVLQVVLKQLLLFFNSTSI